MTDERSSGAEETGEALTGGLLWLIDSMNRVGNPKFRFAGDATIGDVCICDVDNEYVKG
jgi:hypothetical protein